MASDQPRIRRVEVPGRVLEARLLDTVDYADAFWIARRVADLEELTDLARAIFGDAPAWVHALLRLRGWLVAPFGLITSVDPPSEQPANPPRIGDRVGLFKVMALADDEVVLGEDDRHLDFRVSLLRQDGPGRAGVVVTTVVHFHNLLGRAYFSVIRPFHLVVVPAMMRRGVGVLERTPGALE
jgi:hypothetical protein